MRLEILEVVSAHDVPFTVRLVRTGDCRGPSMARTYAGPMPLVEFYDARYDDERFRMGLGHFVCHLEAETLLETDGHSRPRAWDVDLCLHGGIPEWRIDGRTMDKVVTWLSGRVALQPLAIWNCG